MEYFCLCWICWEYVDSALAIIAFEISLVYIYGVLLGIFGVLWGIFGVLLSILRILWGIFGVL